MILNYCKKKITLAGATRRKFMLEVIRAAFAALRWLTANRLTEVPHIADCITEFERETEELAS